MIKTDTKVIEAACDACGKNLIKTETWRENGDPKNPEQTSTYVEYATLRNDFGYGSTKFDPVCMDGRPPRFELCEDCTEKVLKVLGISREKFSGGGHTKYKTEETREKFSGEREEHKTEEK